MHLRTPYMKKIVASFSSFYFFVLPAYCMLYVSKGVYPGKQDCNLLGEWVFSHVLMALHFSANNTFKNVVIFPN